LTKFASSLKKNAALDRDALCDVISAKTMIGKKVEAVQGYGTLMT